MPPTVGPACTRNYSAACRTVGWEMVRTGAARAQFGAEILNAINFPIEFRRTGQEPVGGRKMRITAAQRRESELLRHRECFGILIGRILAVDGFNRAECGPELGQQVVESHAVTGIAERMR